MRKARRKEAKARRKKNWVFGQGFSQNFLTCVKILSYCRGQCWIPTLGLKYGSSVSKFEFGVALEGFESC